MFQFQRCLYARFSVAIPKYKPKEMPYVKDIQMPKRPALDPNDPYERYELVKPRQYEFREILNEKHNRNTYPGSQYVAVQKGGITYHLFDASRIPYGKMCAKIAYYLSGKHKPTYKKNESNKVTDKFIIVNGCNMYLTGRKIHYKTLTYHTGYVGNLKQLKFRDLILQKPEQLVAWTVSKMLPITVYRMEKLDHIHLFRGRFHNYDSILPQFLPHHTDLEYRGSIMQDIKEGDDRTLVHTSKLVNQDQILKDLGDIKQEIMDPADMDKEDIFIPFTERPQKLKATMPQSEYDKLIRRRKHVMKRYRKHMVKPYGSVMEKADFTKSYLVTSDKQLKRLGLQNIKPLDDDPELDDEVVKF